MSSIIFSEASYEVDSSVIYIRNRIRRGPWGWWHDPASQDRRISRLRRQLGPKPRLRDARRHWGSLAFLSSDPHSSFSPLFIEVLFTEPDGHRASAAGRIRYLRSGLGHSRLLSRTGYNISCIRKCLGHDLFRSYDRRHLCFRFQKSLIGTAGTCRAFQRSD